MKKSITILLCVILAMSVLSGCGGGNGDSNAAGGSSAPGTAAPGNAVASPSAEAKVLRASTPTEPDTAWALALDYLAENIEERTNGAYKVDVYYNASLSENSEKTMTEQLFVGTLDICITPASLAGSEWSAFSVPFQFDDRDHIWRVCESDVVQGMMDAMSDKGMKAVSIIENGFRQITNNVKEIRVPSDTAGIKLRTPQAPTSIAIAELMGFNAVAISSGELYVALQQGTADGQENALSTIYAKGFYEVQKYCTVLDYNWSPALFGINQDLWDSFDSDTQAAFTELINEATDICNAKLAEDEEGYIELLREKGVEVYICTADDLKLWKETTAGASEIYASTVGEELMSNFSEAVEAARR